MNEHELRLFLRAFHFWHEQASGPVQRSARTRMLFLCLLIRYTGMRLGEALGFNDAEDMDLKSGTVLVREGAARRIPLTRRAMEKLRELRDSPAVIREAGSLCRMDQGYVRRVFEARGSEAGLPFRVNPSLIRRRREDEMRGMGIAPAAIEYLQGRGGQVSDAELKLIRQHFLMWEKRRHAGRHNTFSGTIQELDRRPFCTRLAILTDRGLTLHARCSTRVASQMEFEAGGAVLASFRSLHGRLGFAPEGRNSFPARVLHVYEDGDVKVILELSEGSKCSVIVEEEALRGLFADALPASGGSAEALPADAEPACVAPAAEPAGSSPACGLPRLAPGCSVWLNVRDADFILSAGHHTSS